MKYFPIFYILVVSYLGLLSNNVTCSQADDSPGSLENSATSNNDNQREELLSLPEVFSKLDFNANSTFANNDDLKGQIALRSSRYWGRLYIDGWPQTIQYFLAHFGDPPPMGKHRLVLSDPLDACGNLENSADISSDTIVIATRGKCTFGTKAWYVKRTTSAAGIIIVNNEPGLDHLPGPDAYDITNFSVMSIPKQDGDLSIEYMRKFSKELLASAITAFVVPINCDHHSPQCLPATVTERGYISNNISDGGIVRLNINDNIKDIEYLLATFGVKVPPSSYRMEFALSRPSDACSNITNFSNISGKAVVVRRGGCSFLTKASNIQDAGGLAVIVGNTDSFILRMGVEPRWHGMNISIPVVMISKQSYSSFVGESFAAKDMTISFTETRNVSSEIWKQIEDLYNGMGWPRSDIYMKKKYEDMIKANEDWPDRVSTLSDGYSKMVKEKAIPVLDDMKSKLPTIDDIKYEL